MENPGCGACFGPCIKTRWRTASVDQEELPAIEDVAAAAAADVNATANAAAKSFAPKKNAADDRFDGADDAGATLANLPRNGRRQRRDSTRGYVGAWEKEWVADFTPEIGKLIAAPVPFTDDFCLDFKNLQLKA